ncbi:putative transport protein [Vibrio astriarenae]|nr:putative transport protein [Vibrio sp. C7]
MFRFLLCSFSFILLYPTAIDLYLVGLPQIAADLQVDEASLHIAFSAYLAGMASTMLFAGRFADSIGRKPVAIFGAVVFIFASYLGGEAQSLNMFVGARFLQGIGAGACYVTAFAIIRDVLDEQRRTKVLSMVNGVTCVVPVIAPVVGHLIMIHYPWTTLFTAMAGMGVAVVILAVFLLRETKPALQPTREVTHEDSVSESFMQRHFLSFLVMTSMAVTVILTYVNVSPMLIMSQLGFERGGYSSVMAGTALVGMVTSFSAPLLLSVFKPKTLLVTAKCLFMIAGVTLMAADWFAFTVSAYLIGFGVVCAAFSLGFGVAMSGALAPFAKRAGMASSILGVSQVCVSALYIWVMGMLGVSPMTMLVTILIATGLVSLVLILCLPQANNSNDYESITSET